MAAAVLRRVLPRGARDLTVAEACRRGVERDRRRARRRSRAASSAFLDAGPVHHPRFAILARELRELVAAARGGPAPPLDPAGLRGPHRSAAGALLHAGGHAAQEVDRLPEGGLRDRGRVATPTGRPVTETAPLLERALRALRRDLNVILARGVWQVFGIALDRYRRTLDAHGVLDFGELLARAQALLGNMDEFARSRYLLEARYHHVLVDEFQDTSRAQWELVSLLVRTWGEGIGLSHEVPLAPSIFIVGDRKQSIYGFRDAEVAVLDEAASAIAGLRPDDDPLQSISHEFPIGAAAAGVRQRRLRRGGEPAAGRTRSATTSATRFP